MPTEVYRVASVSRFPTRGGVRYQFGINGQDAHVPDTLVYTFNVLLASLITRAHELEARVLIGWRETVYGFEVITAQILDAKELERQAVS